MSRPRFLGDQNFRDPIVRGVLRREPTVEFLRARNLELDKVPDNEFLESAAKANCITISHDEKTMAGFAYGRVIRSEPMSGPFVCSQSLPDALVIEQLIMIWIASEHEEWDGRIEFLPL